MGQQTDEFMKQAGKTFLEAGFLSVKNEEIQEKSIQWVDQVAKPKYMMALQDPGGAECVSLSRTLGSVDHINVILLLLPEVYNNVSDVYRLALSFFEHCQKLQEADFDMFFPMHVTGMSALVDSVFNIESTSEMQFDRWKLMTMFYRLGQADQIAKILTQMGVNN